MNHPVKAKGDISIVYLHGTIIPGPSNVGIEHFTVPNLVEITIKK